MQKKILSPELQTRFAAAIVAASNAGGSGSVVGDTTTMMWIDGVSPLKMLDAFVAASVALVIFGIPAAFQQHKFSPILRNAPRGLHIEWTRLGIEAAILVVAILSNVFANLKFPTSLDVISVIGLSV